MGATDLIFKLRNDGYSISADGGYLDISPADDLSPELVKQLKLGKPEILSALGREEKAREIRREKVLAMLEANPGSLRAMCTDIHSDPNSVILTVAIRGMATCEMHISKKKFDAFQLLALIEASEQQTH